MEQSPRTREPPRTPERTTGGNSGATSTPRVMKPTSSMLDVYSALRTAQTILKSEWPVSSIVPTLCTVGMQSSGKTTFVEALTRFPVGLTCIGTGTRCPVRYILSDSDGDPSFRVAGVPLEHRSLIRQEVEKHMKKVKDRDDFSKDDLLVEIKDKGLPRLDITDLPGLKADGSKDANKIKEIVRFYVQQQSCKPIVLVKATESVVTQADVALLQEVGIEPTDGKSLFFVNYINDQVYKHDCVSSLNSYFQGYINAYCGSVRFGMLVYDKEAAKKKNDGLDFEGLCEYYRELPEREWDAFKSSVEEMKQDQHLYEDIESKKLFGISSAEAYMEKQITEFILSEGRTLSERITPLETEYSERLQDVTSKLKRCTPEKLKEEREKYVDTWWKVLRGIQQCHQSMDSKLQYDPMESSQTFSEETASVKAKIENEVALRKEEKEKIEKNYELLKSELPEHEPLEDKYSADASLIRLLDVFGAAVKNQIKIKNITRNEARSISGYAPGQMPGSFDHLLVLKEVATRPLIDVIALLEPMMLHIQAIFEHPIEQANTLLKDQPARTKNFAEFVTAAYVKRMKSQLKQSRSALEKAIREKTKYLPAKPEGRHNVVEHALEDTLQGTAPVTSPVTSPVTLPAASPPCCKILPIAGLFTIVPCFCYRFYMVKFPVPVKIAADHQSTSALVQKYFPLDTVNKLAGLGSTQGIPPLITKTLLDTVLPALIQSENQQYHEFFSVEFVSLVVFMLLLMAVALWLFWWWIRHDEMKKIKGAARKDEEMKKLNAAAAKYCEQSKSELLAQVQTEVDDNIYHYMKHGIYEDVRDDMRNHIRTVEARQIDDDTRLKAKELRTQQDELQIKVDCIREAQRAMEALSSERLGVE